MNQWFRRSTAALNADPVLRALTSAFVCALSAGFVLLTVIFMNDAVQNSMLRGRAYEEAELWVNILIYLDIALLFATLGFFIQSVRLSRPTKPAESFAEAKDWDLEDII
jgi:hypothetical protein